MSIRVLIADDHAAVRRGLALVLQGAPDVTVAGEVADGTAVLRSARELRPDVVLMDARMPGLDGIAATAVLTREQVCEVLVLTSFDTDEYLYGALRAGAAGFLLKSVEAEDLIAGVRAVAAGQGVLEPALTRKVLGSFTAAPPPVTERLRQLDELTAREREILAGVGRGLSNHQIARELVIGETTVKTHVSRVLTKLDLHSRVQAALLAREHRI